jgi:hypothetical protein
LKSYLLNHRRRVKVKVKNLRGILRDQGGIFNNYFDFFKREVEAGD